MAKVARLLDQIVPESYQLTYNVDEQQFRFDCSETLTFELLVPARVLRLHAVGLTVTAAELDGDLRATWTNDEADQTVVLTFDQEIAAGNHRLNLAFDGAIGESLHGFYRSRYERDGQEKWILTTQLEAVHAREAFICVDEPSAKAVFEISLTVPDHLTAISNSDIQSEGPDESGRKTVRFNPTPRMSTYLVAFVIGEFEQVEQMTPEGVTVRVYATPGRSGELAFALDAGVRTLSFYNTYFGLPYPLPKLDMIAVPDFAAGAMENWGAVTYRETALLIDPAKSSLSNKQRVAEVVAHELAHQWFGNLVTMAWWDDLWLNEGFATWVASLAMNELWPEWNVWTTFIEDEFDRALTMDSLANTHPIQVPVDDPRSLDEIFDAISYSKGASVINMIHHYLGAESFQKGLQAYLAKHKFSNSVTHDLWQALGDASGKPVDEVMSAWVSQPGYPIVSFEEGQLTQRRFYSSPREAVKAGSDSATWPVPFSARLSGGAETSQVLMTASSAELDDAIVSSDWFKPNPGQTAVYRTHYTEGMIEALTAPLQQNVIPPADRFGMVSDVFAATEAGISDPSVALKLTRALRSETDYVVWGAVTGGLGSLTAIVEDEALRDRLDEFGGWLVKPNVERLGWEPHQGESSYDTLLRPVVLQQAVRFDNEAVTAEAKRRFDAYLSGEALDPDLRPVILYAAARHGGSTEFDAILGRYRTETSPQAKISLLGSLGRFRKPEMIDRFLKLGLSDDVRPQDIHIILAWGFRNRHGRDKTWTWMKDNWELFVKRYGAGGHMLEHFPLYAASGFASHDMARQIGEFFETHPMPATKRPTAQAVESVELKADWYDRDRDSIQAFADGWSK